ncbi:MAG: U32 family peptidase [Oligoflexia bacterium]|nr:U32 family peptidase [Oligoflexia bacterium]
MNNKKSSVDSAGTFNIELLAPAGDLVTAVTAFNAGADSVYLGLKKFSARKSASNFTFKDLRRLKTYALEKNKKIYVTLNTIVKEDEINDLLTILEELKLISVDGVIIQDLGVLEIIKKTFPEFNIHASTQMTIHNEQGLEWAQQNGIKRVVLPREMGLEAITNLKQQCPRIELEVFIHGALCYSYSGLCLASGLMLNRSGNRGECAQVCRNYFFKDNKKDNKNKEKLYCFSCNDLNFGINILELIDAGIKVFKIEGRMKDKEYVHHVVSLYRFIIDNRENLTKAKIEAHSLQLQKLQNLTKLTFARKNTLGYFHNIKGDDLIDNKYPKHRGIFLGKISNLFKNKIQLKLNDELFKNDQLLLISSNHDNCTHFNAFELQSVNNKKITYAKKDEIINICEIDLPAEFKMEIGDDIYRTHSTHLPSVKSFDQKSIKVFKNKFKANLILEENNLIFVIFTLNKNFKYALETPMQILQRNNSSNSSFETALNRLLKESKDFNIEIELDKITYNNQNITSLDFILPISILKKIKNQFYEDLDKHITEISANKEHNFTKITRINLQAQKPESNLNLLQFLSLRKNLTPLNQHSPFISLNKLGKGNLSLNEISNWENRIYFLPLHPINFCNQDQNQSQINCLVKFIKEHLDQAKTNNQITFALGINNPAHFLLYKEIKKQITNLKAFTDFYLYIANHYAFLNTLQSLNLLNSSDFLFSYLWVESDTLKISNINDLNFPFVSIEDKHTLPLFISQGCFKRFNNNKNSCANCNYNSPFNSYESLINVNKKFKVVVEECLTYFFMLL